MEEHNKSHKTHAKQHASKKKRKKAIVINNTKVEINFKKGLLFKRFLNLFLRGLVVSGVGAALMIVFKREQYPCYVISILEIIAFFVLIFFDLRSFRIKIPRKSRYYKYNITAMAIYCIVATVCAMVFQFSSGSTHEVMEYVYTFPFCVFRAFNIINEHLVSKGVFYSSITVVSSAFIFSALCLLFVASIPTVVKRKIITHHNIEE